MISNKFFSGGKEYSTMDNYVPAPYIRKSIVINKVYKKTELAITALGFYRLFVNG